MWTQACWLLCWWQEETSSKKLQPWNIKCSPKPDQDLCLWESSWQPYILVWLSSCAGVHLGWRWSLGLGVGLWGSSWTVKQVRQLRAWLWATLIDFMEHLGMKWTIHWAESERAEYISIQHGDRSHGEMGLTHRSWLQSGVITAAFRDKPCTLRKNQEVQLLVH